MNGQMYQLCVLTAAGKKALQSNEPIQYVPAKYENEISFSCLRGEASAEAEMHTASNVAAWFEYLKSRGLQDMKVLCPIAVKEKGLDKEYETLSNELLRNIRLAILYAVNEW